MKLNKKSLTKEPRQKNQKKRRIRIDELKKIIYEKL
jgi:hypothetical protein